MEYQLPPKPKFDIPTLPLRISEATDDQLMRLFVQLTRWTDHFAGEFAQAEIAERRAEAVLVRTEAVVLLSSWNGTREERVTVAKAQRAVDPAVEKCSAVLEEAYAKRKLMAVLFGSTERDAALVSREISRRIGRHETNERRVAKWTS